MASHDLVSGRAEMEFRVLRRGQIPALVRTLTSDRDAEGRINETAAQAGRGHFETETGLSVYGAQVTQAFVSGGHQGVFEEDEAWHVRGISYHTASALLELDGERYSGVAMLGGFIGTISVGRLGVDHLSYMPAPGSGFDEIFDDEFKAQARRALALAEAAARNGHFHVALGESNQVAHILRQYKHMNPVLGVFAAYAYYQAGNTRQIQSVIDYFLQSGQPVPFDVTMLAGLRPSGVDYQVAPSFPMLTQGWFLLGNDDSIHPAIANARRNLVPSLWTSIDGDSGRELGELIASGVIP